MLDKIKVGWQAAKTLRWVIVGLTLVYVATGLLLGHLDYQQGLALILQAIGLGE